MHHSLSAALVALTFVATFSAASSAEAYCVYNEGDFKLHAQQLDYHDGIPRGMVKTIKPDDKQCCNWKEDDCNPKGKQTSSVYFELRLDKPISPGMSHALYCGDVRTVPMPGGSPKMRAVKVEAGGYIVVKTPGGKYAGKFTSYTHDHKIIESGDCISDTQY